MIFCTIIIILSIISLIIGIKCNKELLTICCGVIVIGTFGAMFVSLINRYYNIKLYNEHKNNPEFFTNEDRINNNRVIEKIRAYQGTIFSFYNDVNFEYFDIEDGKKIIVR